MFACLPNKRRKIQAASVLKEVRDNNTGQYKRYYIFRPPLPILYNKSVMSITGLICIANNNQSDEVA